MSRVKKRYKLLSIHPRRQHNFEQAAALAELYNGDYLHVTGIYFSPRLVRLVGRFSPKYARLMGKRSYKTLAGKSVGVLLPYIEIKKIFLKWRGKLLDFAAMSDAWQRQVLKKCQPPAVCISSDSYSHLIFKEWKNKSKLVLDLSIGLPQYRQRVLHGDSYRPEMLEQADEAHRDMYRKYQEEVDLADIVLCGSEFVKKTITFFKPEHADKCRVLAYGVDTAAFYFPEREIREKGALKFVYVGTVGARKGAHLLLDAWKEFIVLHPEAELHFFGGIDSEIDRSAVPVNVFLHGSVSRDILIEKLREMDIFILPTTFEGSSIAIYQAILLQLPVITTENSGTVLRHGESCEMIDLDKKGGILIAMNKVYGDADYRKKLAVNAFRMSSHYTWEDYKTNIAAILREAFNLS